MRLLLDTHLLLWAASRPECNDYVELPITGQHAAAVAPLLPIHRDLFDRMLVAQAGIEAATLLTADPVVGQYPGSIRLV